MGNADLLLILTVINLDQLNIALNKDYPEGFGVQRDSNFLGEVIKDLNKSSNVDDEIVSDAATITAEQVTRYVMSNSICTTPLDAAKMTKRSSVEPNFFHKELEASKLILRFVREADRWTALSSLLLKSVAFHRRLFHKTNNKILFLEQERNRFNDRVGEKHPIVDLPRTKYNRPFVPCLNGKHFELEEDCNARMNLSHQFPFICMGQQIIQQSQSALHNVDEPRTSKSPLLGLDVVSFEPSKNQPSRNACEFVEAFRSSFTPWEWERINFYRLPKEKKNNFWGLPLPNRSSPSLLLSPSHSKTTRFRAPPPLAQRSDDSRIHELLLRWAMKEAYTKALGLGMGVDFNSFEIALMKSIDAEDDNENNIICGCSCNSNGSDVIQDNYEEGIWKTILSCDCNSSPSHPEGSRHPNPEAKQVQKGPHHQIQFCVLGRLNKILPSRSPGKVGSSEFWEFIFIPLDQERDTAESFREKRACVCICRGPIRHSFPSALRSREHEVLTQPVFIECLFLQDLIKWHCG